MGRRTLKNWQAGKRQFEQDKENTSLLFYPFFLLSLATFWGYLQEVTVSNCYEERGVSFSYTSSSKCCRNNLYKKFSTVCLLFSGVKLNNHPNDWTGIEILNYNCITIRFVVLQTVKRFPSVLFYW